MAKKNQEKKVKKQKSVVSKKGSVHAVSIPGKTVRSFTKKEDALAFAKKRGFC